MTIVSSSIPAASYSRTLTDTVAVLAVVAVTTVWTTGTCPETVHVADAGGVMLGVDGGVGDWLSGIVCGDVVTTTGLVPVTTGAVPPPPPAAAEDGPESGAGEGDAPAGAADAPRAAVTVVTVPAAFRVPAFAEPVTVTPADGVTAAPAPGCPPA